MKMKQEDCAQLIKEKIRAITEFHFLSYHVKVPFGIHPIIRDLSLVLSTIDEVCEGYAVEMIDRICSYRGKTLKDKNWDDYDQILSIFAEIAASYRTAQIADINEQSKKIFIMEPRANKHSKNPEFSSCTDGLGYSVEVKAPKIRKHQLARREGYQFVSRSDTWKRIGEDSSFDIIWPKDNQVKSFLESANSKFLEYDKVNAADYRLLFIFWDDYIYEPLNALLHPHSGLFTENSYYRDSSDSIVTFPYVDGVIISRQRMYFQHILADILSTEVCHAFDLNSPLPNIFVQNPYGRTVPEALTYNFNTVPPHDMLGSEYNSNIDMIFWMKRY